MARLTLSAIIDALRPPPVDEVHFHNGPQHHPEVCYDQRCPRPRLDVGA